MLFVWVRRDGLAQTQSPRSRLYRNRNLVERFFNKITHFRAIAIRYDKRADNLLAGVKLASLWCRYNEVHDPD
jgi:transposase